jgi:hypothetical protein
MANRGKLTLAALLATGTTLSSSVPALASTSTPSGSLAPCQSRQLVGSSLFQRGTGGSAVQVFRLATTTKCTLNGFMRPILRSSNGHDLPTRAIEIPEAHRTITLTSRNPAYFSLDWTSGANQHPPCNPPTATSVRLTPPNQTAALSVRLYNQPIQACQGGLSIRPIRSSVTEAQR